MEMNWEERVSLCALNRIFGFEPKIGIALVEHFGSATEVFRQSPKDMHEVLGEHSRTRYAAQITGSAFESAAIELEKLGDAGCFFIGYGEPGYPKLLNECDDPPIGLYFRGTSGPSEVFDGLPGIAVVGTRSLTCYGKDWCTRIVEVMGKSSIKPLIVSGLAIGVDITAHRTALECGLPTVAVMATGIDGIYPAQHSQVGERIAHTPGCALVTDYPPCTRAMRINFIRRNRIIAGICKALILVESKIKGGGMITARLASSYNREVFALPGRVDDPVSQGCNLLIRENIAEAIGDMGSLMAKLGLGKTELDLKEDFRGEVENTYRGKMPETDFTDIVKLAMTIKSNRGISIDDLCERLRWSYSRTSHFVGTLQCDGFVYVDLLQHCSPRLRRQS